MIDLKYRARRKDRPEEIVYGYYVKHLDFTPATYPTKEEYDKDVEKHTHHCIIRDGFSDYGMSRGLECIEVDPETLNLYTGIKNYYEGDKVVYDDEEYIITFDSSLLLGFILKGKSKIITNIGTILSE